MKFKRVIAEILAAVLCINTLSISTLAENEAQTFIEVMEQEHIEPVVDQWGVGPASAESGDAALYDAASGDQWAEGEIVAAEAVEGEITEGEITEGEAAGENQPTAEGTASAGTGAEGPASAGAALLGDADSKTYSVVDYDGFSKAVAAIVEGKVASSSIVLKSDINFGSTGQIVIQLPADYQLTINLNGYTITGSSERLFDINMGTVTFEDEHVEGHKESVDGESTTGVVENVKTGSPAGDIMNIGSGEPTVTIKGGIYRAEDVVINHYKGSFYVNAGDEPQFLTNGTSIFKVTGNSVISLAGGAYNAKFPENVSWVKSGYKAYYSEKAKLYVVMEKHNAYLKGINGAKDQGYDTIDDITEAIRNRGSKDNNTIYLMEDFNAGGQVISVPTGYSLVFDLYGHELKGTGVLSVAEGASLVLDDSMVGGYLEINQVPDRSGSIRIDGGSYNTEAISYFTLEAFIKAFLDSNHSATETTFKTRTAGTHNCFMVTKKTDRILVKNKGSVNDFDAALAMAADGDTLQLLANIELNKQVEFHARTLKLDMNGYTLSGTGINYLLALYSSNIEILDSSEGMQGKLYQHKSDGACVYIEGVSMCMISDITICSDRARGTCLETDDNSKSLVSLKNVKLEASGSNGICIKASGTGSVVQLEGSATTIGRPRVTSDEYGIASWTNTVMIDASAKVVIKDGNYPHELFLWNDEGNLLIEGGTFGEKVRLFYEGDERPAITHAVDIRGGKFTDKEFFTYLYTGTGETIDSSLGEYVWVYGGDFDSDIRPIRSDGTYYNYDDKDYPAPYEATYKPEDVLKIPLGYLAPGCYQVVSSAFKHGYSAAVAAAIAAHSVIFGDGLDLKVVIQKNPKLAQIVEDSEVKIYLTWAALSDDRKVVKTNVYEFKDDPSGKKFEFASVRVPFSPQNMTDEIIIEAWAVNNQIPRVTRKGKWGAQIPNQVDTTIREYTQDIYKETDDIQTNALATMLMYGAEAQKCVSYRTGDLADNVEWLTPDIKNRYKDVKPKTPGNVKTGLVFKEISINLGEKYAINLYMDMTRLTTVGGTYRLKVQRAGKTDDAHTDYYPVDTTKKYVAIPGIMYVNSTVTYRVYLEKQTGDDWVPVTVDDIKLPDETLSPEKLSEAETVTTSINRCLYSYTQAGETVDLVNSAYRFGVYAREFAAAHSN